MSLTALVIGLTLLAMVALLRFFSNAGSRAAAQQRAMLHQLLDPDPAPCFTTDGRGEILYRNPAAQTRFAAGGDTLVSALNDHFASPASVLFRLQSRAGQSGAAREDVVTRAGHSRLSVTCPEPGRFLWRLEEFVERGTAARGADGISLPMLVTNKAGVILFCNEALRRLLGGRPKRLEQVFLTPNPHIGEVVEVPSALGPIKALFAEVQGIGERREIFLLPSSEMVEASQLQEDFELVPVALLRLHPDGALIAANRAARVLLGIDQGDAHAFHDLYEGLGRPVQDWLSDIVAERVKAGAEVLHPRSGPSDSFHQVTLRRVVDQGHPSVLAVLQDASDLKRMELQFAQSQKMQAIGQLAAGIAHDFNNLLTAISGHCDLLLMRHTMDDKNYADLVQIQQNSNRAAALVSQLLAFSRKQTLKPERIDLQAVLSDLAHLLNRLVGEKVELQLIHAPDLGAIRADKRQLEQVILNLVVNARDAMAAGGRIRVETEALTLGQELRRDRAVVPPGRYALIRVSDTGKGIPPDQIDKIFEPFFTTKRPGEGTGLGLSTVYGIVKQSGGFVFVDSTPDVGSVFHLYFPIHDFPETEAVKPKTSGRNVVLRPGEGVVLLVEDEAPVRAFASRALRLRGYTVLEAKDAEEALVTLEDPALEVDIFVTDVVMPGLDGPSWVKEALKKRPDAKVVFMSGYAEDCLSEEQARMPNSVFLPKPFSLNELAATVQSQLTGAG
ncbi:hybrid sensor histidine kinase/response regulator [Pseudotabrizicola sp. L79]|uniref:hybrid sensor histidine kinase/response regulator n=1 Tax=Pseudotabrizicola sp. L79 TaxID=3118402 RepID=UPI002F924A88